ncbi:MAG: efflux RND transporter permease subunit, partial [Pseudomonadota bacterium]|nr:efflux RND transporter permease subunit [Pseudomonadota bacterium]
LVDGAIVVTELADRNMANGMDRQSAYIEAAHRMSWPIIASTATTLAAFMPLVFWPGIVGEFMKFLPITLIATLSASLLMALIFIPSLGGVIGKTVARATPHPGSGEIASGRGSAAYVAVMSRLLRHPLKILLIAAGALVGVQTYYATHGNGVSFFPDVEPEIATVMVQARGNSAVDEHLPLVRGMEREILAVGGFQSVFLAVGRQSGGGRAIAADVVGQFTLEFKPWNERTATAAEILAEIRRRAGKFPGIKVETSFDEAGPPTGKPIQILFKSRNPDILPKVVAAARAKFESTPGLLNIEDERDVPGIEWRIVVDRAEAAQFGVDVALVGQYVKL